CARRFAAGATCIKATSLNAGRADHAPRRRPSPGALPTRAKPQTRMKTRAGLFRAVGEPLEVVELDLAEPGPNDVVVRMAAAGICGTDLHQVNGEWQRPTPMVLGHEGAGIVEQVGDEV